MNEIIQRYTCFCGWYLINQDVGLGLDTMLREIYVQMNIIQATVMAMGEILKEKYDIPPAEIMRRSIKFSEGRLAQWEEQYGIKITMRQCGVPPEPKSEGMTQ